MTYLVFKTTYIDKGIPLREGAFFFTRRILFPPLDKRNSRDKAKGLCITSGMHSGELGVRCLSTLNRGQDSKATGSSKLFRVFLWKKNEVIRCKSQRIADTPKALSGCFVLFILRLQGESASYPYVLSSWSFCIIV